jgi:hypothetical protein
MSKSSPAPRNTTSSLDLVTSTKTRIGSSITRYNVFQRSTPRSPTSHGIRAAPMMATVLQLDLAVVDARQPVDRTLNRNATRLMGAHRKLSRLAIPRRQIPRHNMPRNGHTDPRQMPIHRMPLHRHTSLPRQTLHIRHRHTLLPRQTSHNRNLLAVLLRRRKTPRSKRLTTKS